MTSTQTQTSPAVVLACAMFQHLTSISPLPWSRYLEPECSWREQALNNLHNYLILLRDQLPAEWVEMIPHTASVEAWEAWRTAD